MRPVKKAGGYADYVHTRELVRAHLGDRYDWVAFEKAFDASNVARRAMARELAGRYYRKEDRPAPSRESVEIHAAAIRAVGR